MEDQEPTKEELEKLLAQADEEISSAASAMSPVEAELAALDAKNQEAYKEYLRLADELKAASTILRKKKREAELERQRKEQEKLKLQSKLAAIKRAEEEAALMEKALNDLNALERSMDEAVMNRPWFKDVKNHQLIAARKIVMDRGVILADSPGLGKTLSVIATVDMARAMTESASPLTPKFGDSKIEWIYDRWINKEDGSVYTYKTSDIVNHPYDYDHIAGHNEEVLVNQITRPVGNKILYLCPNSMIRNVEEEWNKWCGDRMVVYLGQITRKERDYLFEKVLPQLDDYVIVCNYEAWRSDNKLISNFIECSFDTLIIDEAHNVKNRKSIVWKGVNSILQSDNRPEYVIPMTGTPLLNKPQELYTLLNLVNPTEFYNENHFLLDYCYQNADGFWLLQEGGLARLGKKIAKNFLRRTKNDKDPITGKPLIILPDKTIIHHEFDIDLDNYKDQGRARKQMRDYATIIIDENEGKALSAAAMIAVFTRLRQVETWPAGIKQGVDKITGEAKLQIDIEESQKMDALIRFEPHDPNDPKSAMAPVGLIPDVIEDERVIVFSQFKAPLQVLAERINATGKKAVVLDGDTPEDIKQEIRKDFDRKHTPTGAPFKWDAVLCNYRVGGVGLNMTCATQMFILDREWSPGKEEQAVDRFHRIGQEDPVTVNILSMKGTIDEWLNNIIDNKKKLNEGFDTAVNISMEDVKKALEDGDI